MITQLQIQRAAIRSEFDRLIWRKRRLDERLDNLAGKISELDIEIAAAKILNDAAELYPTSKPKPLNMEIE